MSAYGKAPPQLHDFDTSRSFAKPTYEFASPAFTPQPSNLSSIPSTFVNGAPLSAMAYVNHSRQHYDDQSGHYLQVGTRPTPQVASFHPSRGPGGTRVAVYISSLYDLVASNLPSCSLMFGSKECSASLIKLEGSGGVCQYVVNGQVPGYSSTGWTSSQVPVVLLVDGADGELVCKVDVGHFDYTAGDSTTASGHFESSKRRKMSVGEADVRISSKSALAQHIRTKDEFSTTFGYSPTDDAQYYPALQQNTSYGVVSQYSRSNPGYQSQAAGRGVYQYSNSSDSSPTMGRIHSPSTWSPYAQRGDAGVLVSAPSSQPQLSSFAPPPSAVPTLIRTSQLPMSNPMMMNSIPSSMCSGFASGGHAKAQLHISGNLDEMAEHWTADEWESRRRIVKFKRSQTGEKVTLTFEPVKVDERPPNSICISCIWWQERKECFFTSVDVIQLLERIVAQKLPTKEKNRIRRNLEGYKPITVSKAKGETKDFFTTIMGFPNPKPRNIEKDIKAFPWMTLAGSLTKVIGHFSAFDSSGLVPTPLTPNSSGYDSSTSNSHLQHASLSDPMNTLMSPQPISRSLSNISQRQHYVPSMSTRSTTPAQVKHSYSEDNLRVSVPHYYSEDHQSHYSQQQQPSTYLNPNSAGMPAPRSNWDLGIGVGGYLESNAGNVGAGVVLAEQNLTYAGHDTPVGVSVPKLLDGGSMGSGTNGINLSHI